MEFKCCGKNRKERESVAETYAFLRAVADPNRLKILCILRIEPKCGCQIAPIIGISEKLASHHLGELKKIGLLKEKRQGNFIQYSINKKAIRKYKSLFNQLIK